MKANSLSEAAVQEARARFLALQAAQQKDLSSLKGEQKNTESGGPVNDGPV